MAIVRWDPFRELLTLREEMDRFFGRSMLHEDVERKWAPVCDMKETKNAFVVDCELPGMTTKDIDVNVEGDTLIIRGERSGVKESKDEEYHRVERSYGSFARYLTLPNEIDVKKVKASFDKGVLTIELPKAAIEKAKSSHIQIAEKAGK